MTIDIAVPTYNCARWIDAFMESILAQDYEDWRIITRDDGSHDDTIEHIDRWAERLGHRLLILPNTAKENLGPVGCYNAILAQTSSPWVMLGDPDDVWKSTKIQTSLAAMRSIEDQHETALPVVIFSDGEVVDETGRRINHSYWGWSRQNPHKNQFFHRTLVDSAAISSGMIVNRTLLQKALPVEGSYSYQDWWLMLVAVAFGKVAIIPDALFYYRRHGGNDSAIPLTMSLARILDSLFKVRQKLRNMEAAISQQARAFNARFGSALNAAQLKSLQGASLLASANWFERRAIILRHQLFFSSALKNVGTFLFS